MAALSSLLLILLAFQQQTYRVNISTTTYLRALNMDFLNWLEAVIYTIGLTAPPTTTITVPSNIITSLSLEEAAVVCRL